MRWQNLVGLLVISLASAGCATNSHRENVGFPGARSAMSKTTAPRQVQVAMAPEDDGLIASSPSKVEKRGLSRYFPGLGQASSSLASVGPAATLPSRASTNDAKSNVLGNTGRPSWFGFRKPRPPQTYLTDARSSELRSSAEPSLLSVALQLPTAKVSDKSVTPTSVDLSENPAGAVAGANPVPSNPDSSTAETSPLSTTEPQLVVAPITADSKEVKPPAEVQPAVPSEAISERSEDASVEVPTNDPRERPRLAVDSPISAPMPEANPAAEEQKATDRIASKPTDPSEVPSSGEVNAAKVVPSPADPSNSLGLPPATVPTSYLRHNSVAVRGSDQAPQPPPVLASPQVEAAPRSVKAAPTAASKKTWRRPCLRRLIRRIGKLGEFANPPTAQPH